MRRDRSCWSKCKYSPYLDEVEFATLEWVDWFNNRRLFGPIGYIPPAEFEAMDDQQQGAPATGAALN